MAADHVLYLQARQLNLTYSPRLFTYALRLLGLFSHAQTYGAKWPCVAEPANCAQREAKAFGYCVFKIDNC